MPACYVKLKGLDSDVLYRDTESGKKYYGSALMRAGLPIPAGMGDYRAYQAELTADCSGK